MKLYLIGIFCLVCSCLQAATYGQKVVAAVLMAEAWGEGERAMTAVAEVIRTRADKARVTPLAIVKRPLQFSCLNGKSPQKLLAKFEHKKDFAIALRIARIMYNEPDRLPGVVRNATHFATTDCRVHWTSTGDIVAVIGKLVFYKL